MPAGKSETGGASGGGAPAPGGGTNAAGRGSFKPPWVRDGPTPLPMPVAPWTLNKRGSLAKEASIDSQDGPPSRKASLAKIPQAQLSENGTTAKDPHTFERPKLREVPKAPPKEPTKLQSREVKVPVTVTSTRRDSKDLPMKTHIDPKKKDDSQPLPEPKKKEEGIPKVELKPVNREKIEAEPKKKQEGIPKVELRPVSKEKKSVYIEDKNEPIDKAVPAERNAIVRQGSMKKLCPPPPPLPPPPPPELPFAKRDPLSRPQLEKLDSLRARPRKRPDWGAMMKEVETGKKLKHVDCNDRSQPLLPQNKAKGQFIYESEKANLHNQLLKQIQTGAMLKHVKTNDRSKPVLEGLRKFRRQMTIEEQIQKSQSMANMPEAEIEEEADEMDDIDKVRDDLQSTKQMLALELRNKEAQIRENKRLQARMSNMEAELEKLRSQVSTENSDGSESEPPTPTPGAEDKLIITLKEEAAVARKSAEELEKKFHDTSDQLYAVKSDLDEAKRQNQILEKKLQQALQGTGPRRQASISESRRESVPGKEPPPEEEETEEESETESESGDEDNEEKQKRRAERELRLLRNKLKSYKNKQEAARKERKNLRDQMKKTQQFIKGEKKKLNALQKEVNKMAALMKDDEEDEDEEEKQDVEEEETEEEETETETESESSEEEESSDSEDEEAPMDKRKINLETRVKRHENCLNALRKGNYMLKANVDRLQDDLNKQKETVATLQEDLDSVLAELE